MNTFHNWTDLAYWAAGIIVAAAVMFLSYGFWVLQQPSEKKVHDRASRPINSMREISLQKSAKMAAPDEIAKKVFEKDTLLKEAATTTEDDDILEEYDAIENEMESFNVAHDLVMDDPDPAVRLTGIEASISQRDEDSLDLLWLAVSSEDDADNRLATVGMLEQMLADGRGDSDQILDLLTVTADDGDPRVAELSRLVIEEQFGIEQEAVQVDSVEEEIGDIDGFDDVADDSRIDFETDEESFEDLFDLALLDSDPDVRMAAIEAIHEVDETGIEILRDAALYDNDPDNRLTAVNQFERLLDSGYADINDVIDVIEDASRDLDPRVAELSELILKEHDTGYLE